MTTIIYLLRHAHTTPSPEYAPDFDWPLDDQGQVQANQLVPVLRNLGVDGIYSSPQLRAMQTVAAFARATDLPTQTVDGLAECAFNRVWAVDFLDLVKKHWADFDYAQPDCETHGRCQHRFVRALLEVARANDGKTLVCCSGGQAINLTLHSIDATVGYEDWANIRTPDLFKLDWDGARFVWDRAWSFDPESLGAD